MINRTPKVKRNTLRAAPPKAPAAKPELVKPEPVMAAPVKVEPAKAVIPKPTQPVLPKAHLELVKPEAQHVFVAGSFNGWNPAKTPLKRLNEGKWVGELTGISGRHEYLFVVDGQWLPDPNAKESVQNPFGGRNSVLVVSE
jgi:AMP-activated protein kinase-like protein